MNGQNNASTADPTGESAPPVADGNCEPSTQCCDDTTEAPDDVQSCDATDSQVADDDSDITSHTIDDSSLNSGDDRKSAQNVTDAKIENTSEDDSKDDQDNSEAKVDQANGDIENQEGDEPSTADPYAEIAKLGDDLALARADLYNLRNEYNGYVRRSKKELQGYRERGQGEVLYSLIAVLDDIYAAREAGDLKEGPFASIADKLENLLKTNYQFSRFGNVGDPFDPTLHDALMAQDSDQVSVATITQVVQPGYKKGDTVMRPTKVIVDNPA